MINIPDTARAYDLGLIDGKHFGRLEGKFEEHKRSSSDLKAALHNVSVKFNLDPDLRRAIQLEFNRVRLHRAAKEGEKT